MGIGKRIKEARLMKNMTQEELALKLGITKSAIANYESETSHPKEAVLYKLFSILSVDANFLYQDIEGMSPSSVVLSSDEQRLLDNYRLLDSYCKDTLNILIERELHYSASLKDRSDNISFDNNHHTQLASRTASTDIIHIYPYLHNIASAGTGTYNDDIPIETIKAAYMKDADFIIGVSGDSMEPIYHNGDLLYIHKTDSLNIDDIGIFIKDDSMYIKKVGTDRLISLNKEFPDIYPEEGTITTVGKVLGKVR